MKYSEIQEFTRDGSYRVDIPFCSVKRTIKAYEEDYGLELCPEFQRGHVWTEEQKTKFVEYILKGGITSDIRLNHPGWMHGFKGKFVCVDGLQRLTAIMDFLDGKVPAFEKFASEYTGICDKCIGIRVNNLKTEAEVLQWYIDLNEGGTPHSKEELDRVKKLIQDNQ